MLTELVLIAGSVGGLKLMPDIFSDLMLGAAQRYTVSIQAPARCYSTPVSTRAHTDA